MSTLIARLIVGLFLLSLLCTSLVTATPSSQLESSLRDRTLLGVVQLATASESTPIAQRGAQPADVPMFRGNAARDGVMPGPEIGEQVREIWHLDLKQPIWSSPAIVNGMLIIGTGSFGDDEGSITAIDAQNGTEVWTFVSLPIVSSPAAKDGKIYVAQSDGQLLVLDQNDGKLLSAYLPSGQDFCPTGASPVLTDDVVIASFGCFGQEDTSETVDWSDLTGTLVAFETDTGDEKWRFTFNGFDPTSSPAVSNGIAIISDSANSDYTVGAAYAIDVADGSELWRFEAHTGFISTPAIWGDCVFLVGANGDLFALSLLTGSELWRFKLGSRALQSPAVSDGVVYIGDTIATLFAIDATDGTELWSARPGQMNSSSPVVSANSVFIGGWGGFISRIDRDTGVIDPQRIQVGRPPSPIDSSPVISGGKIFVSTDAGVVYALGDVRTTVPLAEGMRIEIASDTATVYAAPSFGAVSRGEVTRGETGTITGPWEERESEIWWPVNVGGLGTGWITESSIIAIKVPTPTPTPVPTPAPTQTPTPTRTTSEITSSDD